MDAKELARIIREIGRGKNAARDLNRDDARALFAALLAGAIPDLQLGAVLMALRIKGESLEELAGFLEACEASYPHLAAPAGKVPLVIPAYNGARQLPNLTPLLAHLVAREGVPVLVHGVTADAGRVTTYEVLAAMGVKAAASREEAETQLRQRGLAFIGIDALAPQLAGVLAIRQKMGVRSSGHTLAKMLQPFATPALRLVSVTHPEYVTRMREFFTRQGTTAANALLLRGAEGEAVAHPRREAAIDWLNGAVVETWCAAGSANPELPASRDAAVTAAWIHEALAGRQPVPLTIAHQVACCARASSAFGGEPK
ncbi:MAG: DNA-binding protein YbiB [Betaproteobacteria bacterium]|nr:DNA-binding protein YbiB [Betaproteobacteria bacterium]